MSGRTAPAGRVREELERGADPNEVGLFNTPILFVAAGAGDVDAIEALVAVGADIEARNCSSGWTPLMAAANGDHLEAAACLLRHGADVNAESDDGDTAYGRTPADAHALRELLVQHGALPRPRE